MASKKQYSPLDGAHTLVEYHMLRCTRGGSNKFYELELRQNQAGDAAVYVRWGKWASALTQGGGQKGIHFRGNLSACRRAYEAQFDEKLRGGYTTGWADKPVASRADGMPFILKGTTTQKRVERTEPTEDQLRQREAVKAWAASALFQ